MGLWKELRRRHVFKVGGLYAVTAWLIAQAAALAFPVFQAPAWVLKVLIFVLLIGFPIALVLAWALELTPEGIKRSEAAVGQKRLYGTAGVIAVAVLAWLLHGITLRKDDAAKALEPANSIAVLPFLDLSAQGNQEYFAEGISEQLLDILAQSTKLEVAARTSAFQFKGHPEDVVDIGKQLHVRHIIEGSVRRDGDRVRITAQLINAATGYHEWSRTYQRQLTDIFKVQDEISKAIADALEVKFAGKTEVAAAKAVDPKTNPKAYDEYLLGRHFLNRRTSPSLRTALAHFKKAIKIDPDYAPAYAQISIVYSLLTKGPQTYGDYANYEANALAKPYLDRAVALAPQAADTQAAQGRYAVLAGDARAALSHFAKAVAANPSYSDAVTWLAIFQDALGQPRKALATLRAGVERDPLNWIMNDNYVDQLLKWHRFAEAQAVAERFAGLDEPQAQIMQSDIAMAEGHYADAVRHSLLALQRDPGWRPAAAELVQITMDAGLAEEAYRLRSWDDCGESAAYAGHVDEAVRRVGNCLRDYSSDAPAHWIAGIIYLVAGRRDDAREQLRTAWEMLGKEQISDAFFGTRPALLLAVLLREKGETEQANKLFGVVRSWLDRKAAEDEAAGMPDDSLIVDRAVFHLAVGSTDQGFAELDQVLSPKRPYDAATIDPLMLANSPVFDGVRDDPRFRAIGKRVQVRQKSVRDEILPVLCSWKYPADSWHPRAETCKGVPKSAVAASG